jgi:hypothetical protein
MSPTAGASAIKHREARQHCATEYCELPVADETVGAVAGSSSPVRYDKVGSLARFSEKA